MSRAGSRKVRASPVARWDTVVIGAGVFGAWTAWQLRRRGQNVLLVDAWGPAHDRASSGGESRLTRTTYGPAALYSQMAWQSLEQWRWLSASQELPLFHPIGVLFFFPRVEPYVTQTLEVHRALGIPLETLERPALAKRFPQISWEGVEIGLYEPTLGALMARRAVQTLVAIFVREGGHYRQVAIAPPAADGASRLSMISTATLEALRAERYVFACGAWLPQLFPQVLGSRIFPTRQEVFFFTPPPGDARFEPGALPGWADFNEGDIFYGFPDLEGRGFKIANHRDGVPVDPDAMDRQVSAAGLADARRFLGRRFPALADRPLAKSSVCQYENSANGDLLIDRHPQWDNVWLVGAGSGHGFKHGPAVGSYAADAVLGQLKHAEPRFSLATKAAHVQRDVH